MEAINKMPVLFVGHGSPMNAIEDNKFTRGWKEIAGKIPTPKAILSVSAHWYVPGTAVLTEHNPKQIYDMYGFPQELYDLKYAASGSPEFASKVMELLEGEVVADNSWGLDHGTWSVLCKMYPAADIPIFQLSINSKKDAAYHYELGRKLSALREQGVLIMGSGNVVHHLGRINWEMEEQGFPFAEEFDGYIKDCISRKDYEGVIDYKRSKAAALAFPAPDHFYPLLYTLGASSKEDTAEVFNDSCVLGSLSMTSYLFLEN